MIRWRSNGHCREGFLKVCNGSSGRMRELLGYDQTIFKNPHVFELDYIPEQLYHREPQLETLKWNLAPALRGLKPVNTLCVGSIATGKTSVIKKILEGFEQHFPSQVITCYINCQIKSTKCSIAAAIHQKVLGRRPVIISGASFDKLFNAVLAGLAQQDRTLIVALDDLDHLCYTGILNQVLYPLLRAYEVDSVAISVIGAHSDVKLYELPLDPRVDSVFLPEIIEFPEYTQDQIRDILSQRVELGFYPGVLQDEVFQEIVRLTHEARDLRVGIDLLKRVGSLAERKAKPKIGLEELEQVRERSKLLGLEFKLRSLGKEHKKLLEILCRFPDGIKSGELYLQARRAMGFGYTKFFGLCRKLIDLGLVDARYLTGQRRGRTRILKLKHNPQLLLELLS